MDYFRIRCVASFDELVNTPFADGINALCWPRVLAGDFSAVAAHFAGYTDIVTLDEEDLDAARPHLDSAGVCAIDAMIADRRMLAARDLDPIVDFIPAYPQDRGSGVFPTDVYSFHVDRAPVRADTYLCTYAGASSQGLRNEDAIRRLDDRGVFAKAQSEFAQDADANDFDLWLRDKSYDLHYVPRGGAVAYDFGQHNLWRIAIEYPDCPVPPCIHRAPLTGIGDAPRLLLIS